MKLDSYWPGAILSIPIARRFCYFVGEGPSTTRLVCIEANTTVIASPARSRSLEFGNRKVSIPKYPLFRLWLTSGFSWNNNKMPTRHTLRIVIVFWHVSTFDPWKDGPFGRFMLQLSCANYYWIHGLFEWCQNLYSDGEQIHAYRTYARIKH